MHWKSALLCLASCAETLYKGEDVGITVLISALWYRIYKQYNIGIFVMKPPYVIELLPRNSKTRYTLKYFVPVFIHILLIFSFVSEFLFMVYLSEWSKLFWIQLFSSMSTDITINNAKYFRECWVVFQYKADMQPTGVTLASSKHKR